MKVPISLVMTVYNRERYLTNAVESVLTQTREDFELLIWDDGSRDRSVEIARRYAKQDCRVRVVAAEHLGRTRALKAAIAETTGIYIGLVDSDDVLGLTALQDTTAVLDTQKEVGLVYTDYMVIDEGGRIRGSGQRCRIPYSKERLLVNFMIFHFRLIRRSVYDSVGGINESFEYAEDYDLCLRLSEVTEVRQVKKPLYYYREHDFNISHQQQIEQILWSQKASALALERRGLSDRFEINVRIAGIFSLREKKPD
jgi:glycosyltransferase involved in cell wall biosynthesis